MVNLMYHDIVTSSDKKSGFQNENAFMYKVEESVFESQVAALRDYDVKYTFDDGGESFITKIAPILEKYGKRGVFFVSTKYIGTPGFLTESQIKELKERGHQIGSHSHTHPSNISSLKGNALYNEWNESVSILSRILGEKVLLASIPNGYDSTSVIREAARVGIEHLYTSSPTTRERRKYGVSLYGRYVVHSSSTVNEVIDTVNSNKKRFILLLRWQVIEAIKLLLGSKYEKFKAYLNKN